MYAWNVPLGSLIFLKRSLIFPILLFSSISSHLSMRKAFLSLLAILWNFTFKWIYLSFSPLPLASLLFSPICKACSDSHFAFLLLFFLGMVLIPVYSTMSWTSIHSSSGTLSIRSNPCTKKDLHNPDNHNGVITDLEPDILECEVKWALESITTNKASGGDGIPVELFQILKDDAVKVLHSICQQIWKTQQWPQDWKRSVFIPVPKKGNAKECSNYNTIALISHASKVMLKILQARLQQYMNRELPDVQAGFRKGRRSNYQHPLDHGKSKRVPEKHLFLLYWLCQTFDCVDHNKLWKILKKMGIPDHLTCLLRNLYAGQEATVRTGHETTEWFQIGKGVCQRCILSPCLFNLYAEHIIRETLCWRNHKLESRLPGEISTTSDMQMTPPLWQKVKKN